MRVFKQSRTRTTVLTMPAKCVTYWYLLLKGKSMPYRHNILYSITVLAHLVYITRRVYAIILLSVCIVNSINVITVIISVIIDVIVGIIVIVDYLCIAYPATCYNIETSVVQISTYAPPPQEMYIKYEITVTYILSAGSHVSIFPWIQFSYYCLFLFCN